MLAGEWAFLGKFSITKYIYIYVYKKRSMARKYLHTNGIITVEYINIRGRLTEEK